MSTVFIILIMNGLNKKKGEVMLHILAIGSVILGVFEYLLASDKADQIKGLLLIILAAVIM